MFSKLGGHRAGVQNKTYYPMGDQADDPFVVTFEKTLEQLVEFKALGFTGKSSFVPIM